MFLLKPPMCNSSLLKVRKEKIVKATYWESRPVKGKQRPKLCSQEEEGSLMCTLGYLLGHRALYIM